MAFLLNSQTLARPQSVTDEPVEVAITHTTISGTAKRDISARKKRYILRYENISKSDADTILAIYNLKAVVKFEMTETNLTVSERDVLVDLSIRDYGVPGTSYLSNFNLILTEVDE